MKIEILLPFFFLIIGCSSNEYIDNQKMITSTDSLEISEIILEVETDSIGNILDTVATTYLKYDDENRKRYQEKNYKYLVGQVMFKDYFDTDEDLFYREYFNAEGESESIFETKSNMKGRVVKAIQIGKRSNSSDTILMDYTYSFYLNGKVKKMEILTYHEEVGEFNSKTIYDSNEGMLSEVFLMSDDTTSYQTWEYSSDSKLERSIRTTYQVDTSRSIYYYGAEELLFKEEEFKFVNGDFFNSEVTTYLYDETDTMIKSIQKNKETKKTKYIKYLKSAF